MKTAILILAISLFAMPLVMAQKQNFQGYAIDTGNGMVATFRDCDSAGALSQKFKNGEQTDRTAYQLLPLDSRCQYLRGFIDGVTIAMKPNIDIPDSVTYSQFHAVVRHYVENHPEALDQPSLALIQKALSEAWPKRGGNG